MRVGPCPWMANNWTLLSYDEDALYTCPAVLAACWIHTLDTTRDWRIMNPTPTNICTFHANKETTASFTFAETPRESQQQVCKCVRMVRRKYLGVDKLINCFSAIAVPIDIVGIVPVLWYLHLAPVCPLWWGSGEGRVISDTLICLWCSVGCSVDSRLGRGDLNIHHIYQKDTLVHVESAAKVVSPRQLPMVFQNPGWQWCLLVLFQCYSSYFL